MDTSNSYKLTISFKKGNIRRKDAFVVTKVKGECVYAVPLRKGVEDFLFVHLKRVLINENVKSAIQNKGNDLDINLLFEKGNYQETENISFRYKEEEDYKKWVDTVVNKLVNKYLEINRRYNGRFKIK